jgi:hypothetical protein
MGRKALLHSAQIARRERHFLWVPVSVRTNAQLVAGPTGDYADFDGWGTVREEPGREMDVDLESAKAAFVSYGSGVYGGRLNWVPADHRPRQTMRALGLVLGGESLLAVELRQPYKGLSDAVESMSALAASLEALAGGGPLPVPDGEDP